jgi:hypothetical protein
MVSIPGGDESEHPQKYKKPFLKDMAHTSPNVELPEIKK